MGYSDLSEMQDKSELPMFANSFQENEHEKSTYPLIDAFKTRNTLFISQIELIFMQCRKANMY